MKYFSVLPYNKSNPEKDLATLTKPCTQQDLLYVQIVKRCHIVATGVTEASQGYVNWRQIWGPTKDRSHLSAKRVKKSLHMENLNRRWLHEDTLGKILLSHNDADSTSSHTLERDNLYRAAGAAAATLFPSIFNASQLEFPTGHYSIVVTVSLKDILLHMVYFCHTF